ncbi:hypothetical protein [Sphingobacterium corticibacterium]|uniref:Uncharacterized protein n=1 Tax=Sphingobacterium corticibacterium TaxID=2484746 RepID=A0A4Q6XVE2_9SPHI|nr:hypothetical protein [Sphingobacterium corticibacterium]RZF61404.1 hypothetical protein EWE74_00745 [Sphingobacterium corticibacterium]
MVFCILKSNGQDRLPAFVNLVKDDSSADLLTWTDKQGIHFLKMETLEIVEGEESGTQTQWVHIEHHVDIDGERRQTWSYETGEYDLKDFKKLPQRYQDYAIEYFHQHNAEVFDNR